MKGFLPQIQGVFPSHFPFLSTNPSTNPRSKYKLKKPFTPSVFPLNDVSSNYPCYIPVSYGTLILLFIWFVTTCSPKFRCMCNRTYHQMINITSKSNHYKCNIYGDPENQYHTHARQITSIYFNFTF